MTCAIGLDVGGTVINGGLVTESGELLHPEYRGTDRAGGAKAGLQTIAETLRAFLRYAADEELTLSGIGIGFGGPVDYETGTVLTCHHVAGWEDFPLRETLQQEFTLPIYVDNDVNAATLGEAAFGAGRGLRDFVYVNLGTGIGGGVFANGALVRGAQNLAGEIGHMVVDPSGPRCTCGKRGCVEAFASGPGIAAVATRHPGKPRPRVTAEEVFAAAKRREPWAREVLDEVTTELAHGLGNAVALLNPSVLLLGGGVSRVGEALLKPLRRKVKRYALSAATARLEILAARLGYEAGVLGAGCLVLSGLTNQ